MVKDGIKYLAEICFNLRMFTEKDKGKRKIYLFLTPQYLNYGDHAIAAAEKKYFSEKFPEFVVEEINYSFYQFWAQIAERRVKKEDIVIVTGGGYAGDLWPENQGMLEQVLKAFPENTVILAPQTVFFRTDEETENFRTMKELITARRRLCIIAREKNTFGLLKDQFGMIPDKNLFLLPDFVLTFSLKEMETKREGIGLCFRDDDEKTVQPEAEKKIRRTLEEKQENTYSILMAKEHVEIPVWLRDYFLEKKFQEFRSREAVITDRLHGMVFAAVTGTPCVALDNVSRKISGVYQSMTSLSYIKTADNPSQVMTLMEQVKKTGYEQRRNELKSLQTQIYKEYGKVFHTLIN